jgi:PKD repeat protein
MKTFYKQSLLLLISTLVVVTQLFANQVIVKGTVKNSNGAPVANQQVCIADSLGCGGVQCVYTNANGYYIDTLNCPNANIQYVISYTANCNNTFLENIHLVGASGIVESNFITCIPPPPTCIANFLFSVAGPAVQFTSISTVTSGNNDTISNHYWNFGDGTSLSGNDRNPVHTYTQPGNYTVKLAITSSSGCQDTIIKVVTIQSPATGCVAAFTAARVPGTIRKIGFSSWMSEPGSLDTIVTRNWNFGDNTTIGGNVVNPVHEYATNGQYNVCLRIVTVNGCEKTICKLVSVTDTIPPPPSCLASFTTTSSGLTASFNSATSTNANSIVSRNWYFGDGSGLFGTNTIAPSHTYNQPGTYTVCLRIISSNGCIDSICKNITIQGSATGCTPSFVWEHVAGAVRTIKFNSIASTPGVNDTIVSRIWNFGDGVVLNGNIINPTHQYIQNGQYNVCLKIITVKGCEKTFCKTVLVNDTITPPTTCLSCFEVPVTAQVQQSITLNSSCSKAADSTDTIISRLWNFGDGSVVTTTATSIQHTYTAPGTYTICLTIKTARGCEKKTCKQLIVGGGATSCVAAFIWEAIPGAVRTVKFNSSGSLGSNNTDTIIRRRWSFGDSTFLDGNVVAPLHQYAQNGTYNVCLTINTASGCEKKICKLVTVQNFASCEATFTYENLPATTNSQRPVRFNSAASHGISATDTIVERFWTFGDGTSLGGNIINPIHNYLQPGSYNVCLKIRTASGCIDTTCKNIFIPVPVICRAEFTSEKIGPKKMRFNSAPSVIAGGDTIISRRWTFGNGQILTGNVPNPVHQYNFPGTYIVCLRIETSKGCRSEICKQVLVTDSIPANPNGGPVRIVSLYPVPTTTILYPVVWSQFAGVNAEIAIFDIYGVKKWSQNKLLNQGNNIYSVPTGNLPAGPYFFRVTTVYGTLSRPFYKL